MKIWKGLFSTLRSDRVMSTPALYGLTIYALFTMLIININFIYLLSGLVDVNCGSLKGKDLFLGNNLLEQLNQLLYLTSFPEMIPSGIFRVENNFFNVVMVTLNYYSILNL